MVQSPQIQKEAAAIVLGSNFRLVDCYRGEKTDTTHANIFQQIDVEFANKTEYEIRKVGKKIIEECFKEILNIDINIVDTYSYKEFYFVSLCIHCGDSNFQYLHFKKDR